MSMFLDGRSLAQKIADAKELLVEHGYLVRGPLLSKCDVRTPTHLVQYFYDTMARYKPQLKMVYAGNLKKDRAIARRLIEARIKTGISRERALAECCEFVRLLFKFEDCLGLSFPVTSMSVFGQESMGWVTEKLWQMYEGLLTAVEEEENRQWFDQFYAKQEQSIGEERLLKAQDKLDRIRERYAKKEK